MEQYINKSAVVAEIERRLEAIANSSSPDDNREFAAIRGAQHYELINLVQFINTLEVKEVDLKKEMDTYWDKYCNDEFGELVERSNESFDNIAKHFFELGLKAKGG